jgi:hypothetical protein
MFYNNLAGSFDAALQYLAINIRDTATDAILATVFKTTQGVDPQVVPVMTPYAADISAFAGMTVRIDVEMQVQLNFFDAAFDNFGFN